MSQGINKEFIFNNAVDIKFYIKNMYEIKDKYHIEIIAYCIMNNHTHLLIKTNIIKNLSQYMHCLNTKYGLYYNKKYNRVGYVFRDRYKAEGIYSEKQLYHCIKYIFNNPVKAGICNKAEEYEFSNYKKMKDNYEEEEYDFIDVKENKREIGRKIVNDFLKQKGLQLKDLETNKQNLKELLILLRKKHNISFRIISDIIHINREKLRTEYHRR